MPKTRFSLSRLLRRVLEHRIPTGAELEITNELSRTVSPKWKESRGEPGFYVPISAFDLVGQPVTRDLTISGTGANLIGKKVRQLPGVIGWSAVVNSGAQVLGPFRDSDVMLYHDSALPPATWLPEIGTVTEADPSLTGTAMSPKRICAQVAISRHC